MLGRADIMVCVLNFVVYLLLQRFLKYGTALAAKTESDFNSVERVVQYLAPPTEADEETAPEVAEQLPEDWPASECDPVIVMCVEGRGICMPAVALAAGVLRHGPQGV